MGIVLGANHYGKAETRVFRIVRDTDRHVVRDLNVSTSLSGDFAAAHLDGDQGHVLPTDTQKNTVFAFAKTVGIGEIEDVRARARPALRRRRRAGHRAPTCGSRSTPGSGSTTTTTASARPAPRCARPRVVVDADGAAVVSGLRDLVVLKSTGSEFAGFLVDEFTTLPPTHDRVLATSLAAEWTYAAPTRSPTGGRRVRRDPRHAAGAVRERPLAGPAAVAVGDGPGGARARARTSPRSSWSRRTSTTSPSTSARSGWTTRARCST